MFRNMGATLTPVQLFGIGLDFTWKRGLRSRRRSVARKVAAEMPYVKLILLMIFHLIYGLFPATFRMVNLTTGTPNLVGRYFLPHRQ